MVTCSAGVVPLHAVQHPLHDQPVEHLRERQRVIVGQELQDDLPDFELFAGGVFGAGGVGLGDRGGVDSAAISAFADCCRLTGRICQSRDKLLSPRSDHFMADPDMLGDCPIAEQHPALVFDGILHRSLLLLALRVYSHNEGS